MCAPTSGHNTMKGESRSPRRKPHGITWYRAASNVFSFVFVLVALSAALTSGQANWKLLRMRHGQGAARGKGSAKDSYSDNDDNEDDSDKWRRLFMKI